MRVRVYYNLTKHVWSVQKYIPGKGWRVAEHLPRLALHNAKTVIMKHGQQRTRSEGKKYVHAFIEGELNDSDVLVSKSHKRITYNPQRDDDFVWKDSGELFTTSSEVVLCKGAFAL